MNLTPCGAVLSGDAELLRWSVSQVGSEVVVGLEGDLDLATVEPLSGILREILEQRPATVAVDLARVSFLDSTGIRCLVNAARAAETDGCKLVVRRPTATVVRVLGICGVDELLLDDTHEDPKARR
jgi:anti-sigma B factor antagonist